MKIPMLSSVVRQIFQLAGSAAMLLVLSGCELLETFVPALALGAESKFVDEIPSGESTPIRKTTIARHGEGYTVTYEYPNGYKSDYLDLEWRKKRPQKTTEESVDAFNFSGQPGSSGRTSGSVIRTF